VRDVMPLGHYAHRRESECPALGLNQIHGKGGECDTYRAAQQRERLPCNTLPKCRNPRARRYELTKNAQRQNSGHSGARKL
jgi:hypothetical protein